MLHRDRKVVLGIGEILAGDHGLGKHALRLLKLNRNQFTDVEFIEAGTAGFDLEQIIEESSHLLVLDAADTNRAPGTIVEFCCDNLHMFDGFVVMAHQIEFHHVLQLARRQGSLPGQTNFLGIQPNGLAIGLDLSPAVENAMPELIRRATSVIYSWQKELVTEE